MVTLPASYFDAMYDVSPDPWGFADRWYEQRKYALTLASLPSRRYATAYEPGCSIGILTEALADRCDALIASDGASAAVAQARHRLSSRPSVRIEQRRLPEEWPAGRFDLVVVSELLYYFDGDDLPAMAGAMVDAVAAGGTLLAVHWRHPVDDYPHGGDAVHEVLGNAALSAGLLVLARHVEDDFLLEIFTRPRADEPAGRTVSVASREGLV
ncbi:SAM-dependent methyltransferase [Acidothermaceae bacterium B102]|nr:SAM-dependent methyltransferase [Acidothermaceae bacterium B102]